MCNVRLSLAEHVARASIPARVPVPPAGAPLAHLGITDEGRSSPFERLAGPCLCLRFDDWDPDRWARESTPLIGVTPEQAYASGPTAERAAAIARFLRELHAQPEPTALWVHCHAGVSRSGAVAAWVHEEFGAQWASVPRVGRDTAVPNETLLRLLRETRA